MKKSATQFALYLFMHPNEGLDQWHLMRALPAGMSELLQTASSSIKRAEVADVLGVSEPQLKQALINFLLLVISDHDKSPYRGLAAREQVGLETCTFHKRLLQNVFHPDKFQDERSHEIIHQVQRSYDQILQLQSHKNGDTKVTQVQQSYQPDNHHVETNEPVINFQVNDAPRRNTAYRRHQQKKQTNIVLMTGIAGLALASLLVILLVPSSPTEMVRQSVVAEPQQQPQKKIILAGSVETMTANASPASSRYQTIESLDNSKIQALLNEFESGLEADLMNDLLESKSPTQSSRQIMDLFASADQKKVFLHGFSWNPVRNGYYGEGEFLARFQFSGNNQWVTRTGKSTITLSDNGTQLLIEQFHFEDNLH